MFIEKKYLDKSYVGKLCIGVCRFNQNEQNNTDSLLAVAKLLSYIIDEQIEIVDLIVTIYETEHPVYLQILAHLIRIKAYHSNYSNDDIKQELFNLFENKIDANTFNNVFNFINTIFNNIDNNNLSNIMVNYEFDRFMKYLLLNTSVTEMMKLQRTFYTDNKSIDNYNTTLSKVFKKYEVSILSKDITIDNSVESVKNAFTTSSAMNEDIRVLPLLESIKFIEKKRVGIAVGVSGTGKSMFLCHCAADYLVEPKNNNKTNIIFYFTFENSQEETFIRIAANILEVSIDDIKMLSTVEDEQEKMISTYLNKKDKNTILKIIELPPKKHSMATVESEIQKELLKYTNAEVYAVLLDYIDKMRPVDTSNKFKRTDQELGDIVDDFKGLVTQFNCAGISVSQVNREGVKKSKNGDIWDITQIGGSWEKVENADIVILLDVENLYEELGYNIVTIRNAKHRYYKDGTVITSMLKPQYARYYPSPENFNIDQTATCNNDSTNIQVSNTFLL